MQRVPRRIPTPVCGVSAPDAAKAAERAVHTDVTGCRAESPNGASARVAAIELVRLVDDPEFVALGVTVSATF
jgi:hypothetical protein